VYKQVTSFVPMDSVMEKEITKRAGLNLQEERSKRQKTGEGSVPTKELKADEISQEDLQQMIMVVPVEEVYEVIVNGDAPTIIASVSGGSEAALPTKTNEKKDSKEE
ncbi:hypothetical protein Tco_0308982, partial [Tanacetum coccineum]